MTREPFIAHSELTNEIYIVVGKEKYRVTEQAIKAVMAIKALEQEPILDKIRAEIDNALSDGMIHKKTVLGIIDKYNAESEKNMSKHWIDDADHYICPICGFETSSPAKHQGCKCPKCGFQDDKDRAESEVEDGNDD